MADLDLKERFRTLDEARWPDLWPAIEARARRPERVRAGRIRALLAPRRLIPALAMVIVAIAVVIVVIPGGQRSALAVIQEARQHYALFPEFHAVVIQRTPGAALFGDLLPETRATFPQPPDRIVVYEMWQQDTGHWRSEVIENSYEREPEDLRVFATPQAGVFWVSDGEQVAYSAYDDRGERVLQVTPAGDPAAGQMRLDASGLLDPAVYNFREHDNAFFEQHCSVLPDEELLGRDARRIHCRDPRSRNYSEGPILDFDVWLDAQTGLLLKVQDRVDGVWLEVKSIDFEPEFPEGIFDLPTRKEAMG